MKAIRIVGNIRGQVQKIRKTIGWSAKTDIDNGLKKMIKGSRK